MDRSNNWEIAPNISFALDYLQNSNDLQNTTKISTAIMWNHVMVMIIGSKGCAFVQHRKPNLSLECKHSKILNVQSKTFFNFQLAGNFHSTTKVLAERILLGSQCGFRIGQSTTDIIFMQEKCNVQRKPLYVAFVDLTTVEEGFEEHWLSSYSVTVHHLISWEYECSHPLWKLFCYPSLLCFSRKWWWHMKTRLDGSLFNLQKDWNPRSWPFRPE